MAGIVQSHVLSVVLIGMAGIPLVVAYIVIAVKGRKQRLVTIIISCMKAIALCILLSLWFIVPLFDYYFTEPMLVHGHDTGIHGYALEPIQLFSFLWPLSGFAEWISAGMAGEMPSALGWALSAAFPAMFTLLFLKTPKDNLPKASRVLLIVLLVLAALFAWMTTVLFPWSLTKVNGVVGAVFSALGVIQYPWRIIGPLSFLLVIALGLIFKAELPLTRLFMTVCLALSICEAGAATTSFASNAHMFSSFDYELLENKDALLYSLGEYLPQDAPKDQLQFGDYLEKVLHEDPFLHGPETSGEVSVASWEHSVVTNATLEYANPGSSEATITLPLLSYSEWTIEVAPDGSFWEPNNGFVQVHVPANSEGQVRLHYAIPWFWRTAEFVSILCVVGLVMGTLIFQHRKKNNLLQ